MLRRLRDSFGSSPHSGLEITSNGVSGVSLAGGRQRRVTAAAWEALPPGVVRPAVAEPNIADRAALRAAIARVLDRLGGPRRVGLVVPDAAAKVSILQLEAVPRRQSDVDQVVRWQIGKSIPFPVEAAQVAWTEVRRTAQDGHRLLVVVMRRDIVEEYESVCREAGAHAGIVSLATFDVINTVLAGHAARGLAEAWRQRVWMLVHLSAESTSVAIVDDGQPIFYRSRQGSAETDVVDAVHQSAMYFEDRLGGERVDAVLAHVSGDLAAAGHLWSAVEARLGMGVDRVDPRRLVDFADESAGVGPPGVVTAPLGVVLRG